MKNTFCGIKTRNLIRLFVFILAFFLFQVPFLAFSCDNEPVPGPGTPPSQTSHQKESAGGVGAWLAGFFANHISPVDGNRCPCNPSCSAYSAEAFRKHGFLMGWFMTVDRLIREGDEGRFSSIDRQGRILDPVERNDFWWYPPR